MTTKVNVSQIDEYDLASSMTPLAAGASYVGDVVYVGGYTHICGFAFSNVSSATSGLIIEQGLLEADFPAGTAATTLVTRSTASITAGDISDNSLSVQIVGSFARIIYVNGAAPQTSFRLLFEARVLRGL